MFKDNQKKQEMIDQLTLDAKKSVDAVNRSEKKAKDFQQQLTEV